MILTEAEKDILLTSARKSIQALFGEVSPTDIDYKMYPNLRKKCGAFVTLTNGDNLRGCIGYIFSNEPLLESVIDLAKQAAVNDPRFFPVEEDELDQIDIEISVLSPLNKIKDYSEIVIGRDGLLLDETRRAVLLPQVAVEHGYDADGFLSALCYKAGMPKNEWQRRKLQLQTFTSIIFSEKDREKVL